MYIWYFELFGRWQRRGKKPLSHFRIIPASVLVRSAVSFHAILPFWDIHYGLKLIARLIGKNLKNPSFRAWGSAFDYHHRNFQASMRYSFYKTELKDAHTYTCKKLYSISIDDYIKKSLISFWRCFFTNLFFFLN